MVTLSPASVVIVPFPFSDLSGTKLRPALVVAETRNDDWLLCQITSNSYADPQAVPLSESDLAQGVLHTISFARPMKLFTANRSLIVKRVAVLKPQTFRKVLTTTIESLQKNMDEVQ